MFPGAYSKYCYCSGLQIPQRTGGGVPLGREVDNVRDGQPAVPGRRPRYVVPYYSHRRAIKPV